MPTVVTRPQEDTLAAPLPHASTRRAVLAGVLLPAAAGIAQAHEGHPPAAATDRAAQPFLAENEAAMARMMQAMAVPPSGDVDCDFVAMMTAHHQGAIDMAMALLRHGGNLRLRRLAQEIIITQRDLAGTPDGSGPLEPLAAFTTNPAGAAIVNAVGPIRQIVAGDGAAQRRFLVIAANDGGRPGMVHQVQQP